VPKPIEQAERGRPDGDKRIVRVRLKVITGVTGLEIVTELESPIVEDLFNGRDAEDFDDLKVIQGKAKANTDKRRNAGLSPSEREVPANNRVTTDDYTGEPPYIHAGIHLVARTRDEIEFYSDQRINFIIDVGHDPELHFLTQPLPHSNPLSKKSLHASQSQNFNPFTEQFPKVVVSGKPVRSGAVRLQNNGPHPHPDVAAQKFYKFNVTVLGTQITLDPHIDAHDD